MTRRAIAADKVAAVQAELAKGTTQKKIVALCGVSAGSVSRIKNNQTPSLARAEALASGDWFTPADVAGRLNVSVRNVYHGMRSGTIPRERFGDSILIPKSYVNQLKYQR